MESEVARVLTDKISHRTLRLAVLGSGYVGLPTAALFAEAGFNVTAIDLNDAIVEKISNGDSPIREPGLKELVFDYVQKRKLKAVSFSKAIFSKEDCVVISVQTPIDTNKKPDLSFLMNAVRRVGENLRRDMLIVVCSTLPPNTLSRKVKPLLESSSDLVAEADFCLAYVPERIAPGKALREMVENTRLVGGVGPYSGAVAADLFKTICKNVVVTDAVTAEVAKLSENTFRSINIAFANELALLCEEYGADVTKVVALANTHPRVKIHSAGPGAGGPCLTKDPYLLVDGALTPTEDLVGPAGLINNFMPHHVVELVLQGLKCAKKTVRGSRIAVLGAAYKGDIGDSRSSPSEPIVRELMSLGSKVVVFDPFCKVSFGGISSNSVFEAVKDANCVIVVTDHTVFRELNLWQLKELMIDRPVLVDCRRILDPSGAEQVGFYYYGVGYGKSLKCDS